MTTHHVFVSRPTTLSPGQERFCHALDGLLRAQGLTPHTVGTKDFSYAAPLKRILEVMNGCDGACVLGFVQARATELVVKPGTQSETTVRDAVFPTPWNQLEAGMALIKGLPCFVIAEQGIRGGIFDDGVGDSYIHRLPIRARNRWLDGDACLQSLDSWIKVMDLSPPRRPRT